MGTRGLSILLQLLLPIAGGGKRDRTADLLHAMQALSQLSYTPDKRTRIILSRPVPVNVKQHDGIKALLDSVQEVCKLFDPCA